MFGLLAVLALPPLLEACATIVAVVGAVKLTLETVEVAKRIRPEKRTE